MVVQAITGFEDLRAKYYTLPGMHVTTNDFAFQRNGHLYMARAKFPTPWPSEPDSAPPPVDREQINYSFEFYPHYDPLPIEEGVDTNTQDPDTIAYILCILEKEISAAEKSDPSAKKFYPTHVEGFKKKAIELGADQSAYWPYPKQEPARTPAP